jgi:major membrane immunogen (membrane-anchored lipoprotein)
MKNTKILTIGLSLILVTGLFAGCGSSEKQTSTDNTSKTTTTEAPKGTNAEAKYKDGIYFAQSDSFDKESGWKEVVTIEVKEGKIISANWNGASKNGGADKITQSKNGKYGMKAIGKSKAEWHEETAKAEAYLIEKQDPTAIKYTDEEGHTDAISGVSIHVSAFFKLAEKALASGPATRGKYKDGAYHAEQPNFDAESGWKETADLTVIYGNIVAVNWNGVHKDGGDDKKTQSINGKYGMKEIGKAKAEWHEQAAKAEAYLIEKQDPTAIKYTDKEGRTDAISGVSIHVSSLFKLAEEALNKAK